ncbi:MAG: hypothetical protein ACFFAU_01465 [Candidatus Hodarchaeota archaeon]
MKTIPCFICKKATEVQDRNAIAKLCKDCNTPENREILKNTPVRQLLRNLDEGISERVDKLEGEYKGDFDKVNQELNKLTDTIANLRTEIKQAGETKSTVVSGESETQDKSLDLNEYGEIV